MAVRRVNPRNPRRILGPPSSQAPAGPGPPPPSLIRILDNFLDADATALPAHVIAPTNVPVTSWSNVLGSARIESNAAQGHTVGINSYGVAACNAGISDFKINCTFNGPGTIGWGVMFRLSDSNNFFICVALYAFAVFQIYRVQAGAFNAIATASMAFSAGVDYAIELIADGANLSATVNGATPIAAIDAFNLTETTVGLYWQAPLDAGAMKDFEVRSLV